MSQLFLSNIFGMLLGPIDFEESSNLINPIVIRRQASKKETERVGATIFELAFSRISIIWR